MKFKYMLIMILISVTQPVFAFSKLKNGFETITSTYLIPLAGAVAGASFILFVTLSFFKQDEYQKKAANVAILSIFAGSGLELIRNLIQSFS
ncbi:MAG: hypothetical protein NXH75_10140 [Halobacteriovoraceae bacterium]|nr:hypothetical protein [Halobacteriovoraceae bacterium]